MASLRSILQASARWGEMLETIILVVILSCMILFAAAQILLRNFADISFIWGDELLRMLVLWLALAGAVAASRTDKHINIAVLDRFLPSGLKKGVALLIHIFTATVCAVIAWFSLSFVLMSKEFADVLLGNVPAWWLQSVLPLGFALIAWRYLVFSITDIIGLFHTGADS